MSDAPIIAVVMAGGTGSRLWPLSRELYPKQFYNSLVITPCYKRLCYDFQAYHVKTISDNK